MSFIMFGAIKSIARGVDSCDLGGWLMLLSGALILGATTLVPVWRDVLDLRHKRDVLAVEADRMRQYRDNYQQFIEGVQSNDPILIQRLAWHMSRMKPKGTRVLGVIPSAMERRDTYEQWLAPPAVQPPTPKTIPDSHLIRLTTGPKRPWVIAIGGWLIVMGLLLRIALRDDPCTPTLPDEEPTEPNPLIESDQPAPPPSTLWDDKPEVTAN